MAGFVATAIDGRMREFVRGTDDERVEGVVVIGVALEALLLLLAQFLGHDEFHLQAGAEHLVERFREQGGYSNARASGGGSRSAPSESPFPG